MAEISIISPTANMSDAVRLISIRRGYDPRDFALVAFGGAGPLHGAALAKDLSIPTVLIPPNPGVTSALGCLLVDIKHDISTMFLGNATQVDPSVVEKTFQSLEAEGRDRLEHEGVPEDRMLFQRFIDMRYLGQWRSMAVAVGTPIRSLEEAMATFHEEHGREHNYKRTDAPVEVYRLSVSATGLTPKAQFATHPLQPDAKVTPIGYRDVKFDEAPEPIRTPLYNRDDLPAGVRIEGPAIIDQLDSTTVVPPGITAEVDASLTIIMKIPLDA